MYLFAYRYVNIMLYYSYAINKYFSFLNTNNSNVIYNEKELDDINKTEKEKGKSLFLSNYNKNKFCATDKKKY